MREIKTNNGIPILLFLDDIETETLKQAEHCASLPHAFKHIALMPDAHQGYAMPVGGVMALDGAVMPNAVGVDIGCGMIASRTNLQYWQALKELNTLTETVMHRIPLGFSHHKHPQQGEILDRIGVKGKEKTRLKKDMPVVMELANEIPYQLGTLGGGNHFIEFQKDQEDMLWIMLHSGSRNIGLKIANHYHKIAKEYTSSKDLGLTKDYAFLTLDLPEAEQYLNEMQWALDFAMQNRQHMQRNIFNIVEEVLRTPVEKTFEVKTHHNYAAWETHFGKRVLVHRKGAVRAFEGEYVTIPGSMGTFSYIGIGKGFPDSFSSCSHGAGRMKGRKQAKKEISEHEFKKQIKNVVVATPKIHQIIDEAPAAYKNIEDVMRHQQHMVEVAYKLEPIGVVKG